jgi:hypothetical protein
MGSNIYSYRNENIKTFSDKKAAEMKKAPALAGASANLRAG